MFCEKRNVLPQKCYRHLHHSIRMHNSFRQNWRVRLIRNRAGHEENIVPTQRCAHLAHCSHRGDCLGTDDPLFPPVCRCFFLWTGKNCHQFGKLFYILTSVSAGPQQLVSTNHSVERKWRADPTHDELPCNDGHMFASKEKRKPHFISRLKTLVFTLFSSCLIKSFPMKAIFNEDNASKMNNKQTADNMYQ
uniref:EGF-like domain-containing protein n=1 Tax=Heterorhabditis bacteriophora TaxID=37862 RepID=A0A1I7WY13_HETBA